MKPSSPAIALSSGLIDQVLCEPLNQPDIDHLKYSWHQVQEPQWPYNMEHSVQWVLFEAIPSCNLKLSLFVLLESINKSPLKFITYLLIAFANVLQYTSTRNWDQLISVVKYRDFSVVVINISYPVMGLRWYFWLLTV